MARLRYIRYKPHRCTVHDDHVTWAQLPNRDTIEALPQILWNDSAPWREANLWAMQRATERSVSLDTVRANMASLLTYANWLENSSTDWWSFPVRKSDRCLVQYRGYLIQARDKGLIAPSTTTQRMRDVINFYRWLKASGLLSAEWPLWRESFVRIKLTDTVGFERTMAVQTTDLAIKNRKANVDRLEDGLLPVTAADRDLILAFAKASASWEMFLFLTLGFYTGMRVGTLSDLKVDTVKKAIPEPGVQGLYKMAVGPGASPPVDTKFGVTGHVWITQTHLDLLLNYIESPRRKARVTLASSELKNNVFLTKYGNAYTKKNTERSSALNVEMYTLRKNGLKAGILALEDFHFHQSRCTFATQLAMVLIPIAGTINALALIREALLHKDEATSIRYIKFVEKSPAKAAAANDFTKAFLGIVGVSKENSQ
jgi:integrase